MGAAGALTVRMSRLGVILVYSNVAGVPQGAQAVAVPTPTPEPTLRCAQLDRADEAASRFREQSVRQSGNGRRGTTVRRVDWRGLESFNNLREHQAIHALYQCCSSCIWALRVAASRPYADEEALFERSDLVLAELSEAELDEALDGHPRIGDRPTSSSSASEQSGVAGADESVLAQLKEGNAEYEEKFGHVYLVFANGRPAAELLAILRERMKNDAETERRVMRMELAKINRRRLKLMLEPAIRYVDEEEDAAS
jgi:2-oxo-4-hydroxy-4-carboxy-5-ureidoimidazoline decarboxylase